MYTFKLFSRIMVSVFPLILYYLHNTLLKSYNLFTFYIVWEPLLFIGNNLSRGDSYSTLDSIGPSTLRVRGK